MLLPYCLEQQQQHQQQVAQGHHLLVKGHHHQQQQQQQQEQKQQRRAYRCQNLLLAFLITFTLCMQYVPVSMGRQLANAEKRQRLMSKDIRFAGGSAAAAAVAPHEKRSSFTDSDATPNAVASQPEEIFSAPTSSSSSDNDMDTIYDEYPMVVPKRAALLLDRLMVALHHALEHERSGQRISQYYGNQQAIPNDLKQLKVNMEPTTNANSNEDANTGSNNMYSDDDPSVMLDYDFKDLNSINRATGETLMPKSFQRRANEAGAGEGGGDGVGGGIAARDSMALLANTAALSGISASGGSGGGGGGGGGGGSGRRINAGNGGRMYWRCYFNAVSCF